MPRCFARSSSRRRNSEIWARIFGDVLSSRRLDRSSRWASVMLLPIAAATPIAATIAAGARPASGFAAAAHPVEDFIEPLLLVGGDRAKNSSIRCSSAASTGRGWRRRTRRAGRRMRALHPLAKLVAELVAAGPPADPGSNTWSPICCNSATAGSVPPTKPKRPSGRPQAQSSTPHRSISFVFPWFMLLLNHRPRSVRRRGHRVQEIARAVFALGAVERLEVVDDPHARRAALASPPQQSAPVRAFCSRTAIALVFVAQYLRLEIRFVIGVSACLKLVAGAAEQLLVVFDVAAEHLDSGGSVADSSIGI